MKVIRSKRLENVLKDPKASEQLRVFLASASLNQPSKAIETRDEQGEQVRYVPKLVPVLGSGT
ncbi:hypothetical protein BL243_23900 [Ralstonia solanacearum]|nr:hypothetical protein CJO74_13805 [Ralstonia solanacearum]OIT11489.1 hypothetical protein BL243_23900 [Ralstonia solanacearum]